MACIHSLGFMSLESETFSSGFGLSSHEWIVHRLLNDAVSGEDFI